MQLRRRWPVFVIVILGLVATACGGAGASSASPPSATPAGASSSTSSSSAADPAELGDGGGSVPIPVAGQPPVSGVPWYLAVGDSITFGYTLDPARAGVNSSWALQLQGLLASRGEPWKLYDTACSGERTDTYYRACSANQHVPFLAGQSQHDAAMAAIRAHRADLKLILVDLGSNDLLRALRFGESPTTAASQLHASLTRIVNDLEQAAPGVPVVVANYYNPLANIFPATQAQLKLVNDVVQTVATDEHARLADFFGAVNTVPDAHDPHLCDYVDCAHTDIHPTVAGHTRLAQAALAVIP
ncbi:MAG TPA: SGNH/GDSL hydrolase family protein [Candidatus Dormibacteraeota bacterium]